VDSFLYVRFVRLQFINQFILFANISFMIMILIKQNNHFIYDISFHFIYANQEFIIEEFATAHPPAAHPLHSGYRPLGSIANLNK